VKRAHAAHRMLFAILGVVLLSGPLSLAQEEQPAEEEMAQKKFNLEASKLSFGGHGQVSVPLDPYLETHDNAGPGFGLGVEYELASWVKVGVGFRYSHHKGVDRTVGTDEHRIDWRTTGESIYGKFFPGYSEELPIFALAEISFCQFHPTHHVSYLDFPYGGEEEDGKTRTRIGFGIGVGLETEISQRITLNLQTLFTTFDNKNLGFGFDSGYHTRISDETRLLILQAGMLYSPF
jgi:opacity protein-like surface antigen